MTYLPLGFPRLSGIVEEVGYLMTRFVAVPVAVFAEHGIQFGNVFFFSAHTFHKSVYIMGGIPSIVAGSSFGDEAGEGKSVTGIAEETAVSVSALGISGARVYYVTVISCTYH
jgi:hypothetical protein